MKIWKIVLQKFLVATSIFLVFLNCLIPLAFAQEATSSDQIAPTESPSPSPEVNPSPEVSPSPIETPTPSPDLSENQSTPSADESTPSPSDSPQGSPNAPPTETPLPSATVSPSPSLTPAPVTETPQGNLSVTIEHQSSQADLKLDLSQQGQTSASLTTDKADYSPIDTVIISGSNFTPNTAYTLIISSEDPPAVNFETQITTDGSGNFIYSYQLDGNYRPNYSVELKDLSGLTIASTTFTDAPPGPKPNLTATKTNNVSGATTVNSPFTWKIHVPNTGTATATFSSGNIILQDNLPSSGATYTNLALISSATTGTINCSITSNNLVCAASGTVTLPVNSFFDVSFTVTPTASGSLVNPRSGGGNVCKVDPNGVLSESATNDNSCSNTVTISPLIDLTVTKSNNVSGSLGLGNSFSWALHVSNSGLSTASFSNNNTILVDNMPDPGSSYGVPSITTSGTIGTISCSQAGVHGENLTCKASGTVTLPAGSYFDISVSSTPPSAGTLINPRSGQTCMVDSNNNVTESSELNNNCNSNSVTVISDTSAPSAPGAPTTTSPTNDNTPTWAWTPSIDNVAVDHYVFYWDTTSGGETNNSGNIAGTTTSFTHSSMLSDGIWYAKVKAFDTSMNSSASANNSVIIDTAAPVLSTVSPVVTPTNNNAPQYTFNSTEEGTISYGGDCLSSETTAISGNNTITFNTLSEGMHSNCTIRVTDLAGNQSNNLAVASFTIDLTAPSLISSSLTNGISGFAKVGDTVILTFTTSEQVQTPAVSIAGHSVPVSNTGGNNWTASYTMSSTDNTEGSIPYTISLVDMTGNSGGTLNNTSSVSFDKTLPITSDNTDSSWHNSNATVTLNCSDTSGCANTYYTTDNSDPLISSTVQTGSIIVLSIDGTYTIKYYSKDNAGNSEAVNTAVNTVKVDKTAPTVASPSATTSVRNNKPNWTWTASSDSGSGLTATPYTIEWSQDSSFLTGVFTDTTVTNSFTHTTALADGTWYFRVKATDIAGNSSTSGNASITIDTTAVTTSSSSLSTLFSGGYFKSDATSSAALVDTMINVATSGGTNSISLPAGTVITKTDGSNLDTNDLSASDVSASSLSGLGSGVIVDGALQWGIPGIGLTFSQPITLKIFVGTALNGQTLNIVKSNSTSSGWTSSGIVAPATCLVASGLCTFQATSASYYATTHTVPSNNGGGGNDGGDGLGCAAHDCSVHPVAQNLVLGISASTGVLAAGFASGVLGTAAEKIGNTIEQITPSGEGQVQGTSTQTVNPAISVQSSGGFFGAIVRFFGAIFGFIAHLFGR